MNFVSGASVLWGTTALATTYVNAAQLTATVPASLIAAYGTASVSVSTSGGTSAGATFTIVQPAPVITSLSPDVVKAGGNSFPLTVNGTGFVAGARILFGTTPLTTHFVSSTELTTAVPSGLTATPGTAYVTVSTFVGTSPAAPFYITP
jgi:hypothetical protein